MSKGLKNSRQAQQLVEFAIVVPILMIFIFIVVEIGAAVNARIAVAEGVKSTLVEVNKLSNLAGDTATKINTVETFIENTVIRYLIGHNIPNSASIEAKVTYDTTNDTATALVTYQYNPYFLMSGLLSGSIPESLAFSSSQTLNPHIFKPNNITSALTAQDLSEFFTDGGGNFIPSGALIDNTAFNYTDATFNVREHIAFLVRMYEGQGTHPYLEYDSAHARLIDWMGNDLLPPNLRVNIRTGTLEVRTPYYRSSNWFDTKIPYVWVASSLGFTHIIYVKFNDYMMLWDSDSDLLYRTLMNNTNVFYNRQMIFCQGFGGALGNCDGDQRDTANINERALRMNPRLGEGIYANDYNIGTMEPIFVNPATHDFRHVKSHYVSYTTDYSNWPSATWNQQYFITISSPRVFGLEEGTNDLPDTTIHADFANAARNPFFQAYRYRFKLFERTHADEGACNLIAAAPAGEDDDVDTYAGGTFQVNIQDVYIDSDGDGIPDAWDRDPEYFDVNVDGDLDGNAYGLNMWTETRCRDGSVAGICATFPDNLQLNVTETPPGIIDPAKIANFYASPPNLAYYISTPYTITGASEATKTARYLPGLKAGDFVHYDYLLDDDYVPVPKVVNGPNPIYYRIDATNLTRRYPTWWELADEATRRPARANFIHGTLAGNNINLNASPEFTHLNTGNVLGNGSYITRTAPGW